MGEDEAFARELCHTFIGTAGEALQKLDIALASGDRAALASSAHRLKGGSQSICADRIARLAQALEYGAQSQSLQFLEATLGELRNAISECAQFLGERLSLTNAGRRCAGLLRCAAMEKSSSAPNRCCATP